MFRTITKKFVEWREAEIHKPLLVQGVRQCGKTYSLKHFGEKYFNDTWYINFEKKPNLGAIFDYDFDTDRILNELSIALGKKSDNLTDTLIIFDEIQDCPKAVTSLKYFCEDHPELYLAAAGSLLGPAINHKKISFPVGKVTFLHMYPLSFKEFAIACGMERELELISTFTPDRVIPEAVSERLERMCREFYVVGGMPEAVSNWLDTHDFEAVRKIQRDILDSYAGDFGKYLSPTDALKVSWIWDSIPVQLAKENKKFVFSHVKSGKRSADLEDSLEWLDKSELTFKCCLVGNPELPLSANADMTYFKLYTSDVGLLGVMCGLTPETILEATPAYKTFKGALTENFVMNELVKYGYKPYFWRSGASAEVDFLIEDDGQVVPIEAKAESNTKAKSYGMYCKRYNPRVGFRLSMKNMGENIIGQTRSFSLPLYLIWKLRTII